MNCPLLHCSKVVFFLVLLCSFGQAEAKPPEIVFDTATSVGCQTIISSEFSQANPDEKLVEARIQVSALFRSGEEQNLVQFFYSIESPQGNLQIADYLPKTTVATNIAGNVAIEKKQESSQSLGFAVSGAHGHLLNANGSGNLGSKKNSSIKYELLPPMNMLIASGTLHRGAGVYFKLKPSPRISLEGSKEFVIIFRVPKIWRGDIIHLTCTAQKRRRGVVRSLDEVAQCGTNRFMIYCYLDGDTQAKEAAAKLAQEKKELIRVAAAHRQEIEKRSLGGPAHKFAVLLAVVDPRIPETWLQQILFSPAEASAADYLSRLPAKVQNQIAVYKKAKRKMENLNGSYRSVAQKESTL